MGTSIDSASDGAGPSREVLGATIVAFGRHRGQRFDSLRYDYRLWAVYCEDVQTAWWHDDFERLHKQLLAEQRPFLETDDRPGNRTRKWANGQPFRKVYGNKKWLNWMFRHFQGKTRWDFLDLLDQYEAWLRENRRPCRPRQSSGAIRHVGEKVGPWDDKLDAPPENDEYDLDDPFIDDRSLSEIEADKEYMDDDSDVPDAKESYNDEMSGLSDDASSSGHSSDLSDTLHVADNINTPSKRQRERTRSESISDSGPSPRKYHKRSGKAASPGPVVGKGKGKAVYNGESTEDADTDDDHDEDKEFKPPVVPRTPRKLKRNNVIVSQENIEDISNTPVTPLGRLAVSGSALHDLHNDADDEDSDDDTPITVLMRRHRTGKPGSIQKRILRREHTGLEEI